VKEGTEIIKKTYESLVAEQKKTTQNREAETLDALVKKN
jgi:hypothetical protein